MSARAKGRTLIDRARAGLPVAWRDGEQWRHLDLEGAVAEGADLSGADLHRARLSGARLARCDLQNADLRYAELTGAELTGADLRGADLRGADLRDADLSAAALSGAVVDRITLLRSGWSGLPAWAAAALGLVVEGRPRSDLARAASVADPVRAGITEALLALGADGTGLMEAMDAVDQAWHRARQSEPPDAQPLREALAAALRAAVNVSVGLAKAEQGLEEV
ncbi:MAG: pentapeptide repeat-containing protein [Alphaproteobacteria bacterium]|nr:pentapeptide repeat-containing protein [Alphaproteobacteria bacterium]